MANTFKRLAETARQIAEARNRYNKIVICAEYFQDLNDDKDLELAARFLGEGAFSSLSGKRAVAGSRTYSICAAEFCEIDYEKVFKPCKTAIGNAPEAIEKLMNNIEAARNKRTPARLSLTEVESFYKAISEVSPREDKKKILWLAWSKMTPVEIKYFIRIMTPGSLLIGFENRSVVSAIAKAFSKKIKAVRYAHMLTGSIGRTAVLCKNDRLDEAAFNLFHPVSFMLASPLKNRSVSDLSQYIAEEKFDGMRCQLHICGNCVKLYSRNLNNITQSFPEIVDFFAGCNLPDLVLDGEVCLFKDNKIHSFQRLQKRIALTKPSPKIMRRSPVLFIAFDVLYYNKPVFDKILTERRNLLEGLAAQFNLPVTNQFEVTNKKIIDLLFERAVARGNEGLILKKKNSVYEYGQRSTNWIKVKQPGGTLDAVIMYAHAGSGKRGGYYSGFTLGINVREDMRYEEEFIPIGKTQGSFTNDEMKKLNEKIVALTAKRYGPTLGLIPEIVVELEFDAIQLNKRTKANYTLRLPRFKAIRWDLDPKDADTLKNVERMYHEKLKRKRLKQDENPSFYFNEE